MQVLVKELKNGCRVVFDSGRFDEWCVFVVQSDGSKSAPTDIFYFKRLSLIAKLHAPMKVYKDFLSIYSLTTKIIEPSVLELIETLSEFYNNKYKLEIEQWFTVLYAGMIAEENKLNAILKKRIKRLGMFQVLVENKTPEFAANFSKGKSWRILDEIMRNKGF